jgi:hypothetical protein
MTPETRQRLLDYARSLVDEQVESMTYLAGHRTVITDRLVSFQLGQAAPPEVPQDIWVRVWAELTYTQTAVPSTGVPYPTKTVTLAPFPVFTLYPPSNPQARKNQLDQFDTWLTTASDITSPTTLAYPNSDAPLVLAQNGSAWSQFAFPPNYPTYPGSAFSDPDLLTPFRIGGPVQIFQSSILVQTVEVSASVRLYVRGHIWSTLDDFTLGGGVTPVRLTVRQVGTQENPVVPGTASQTLVTLQDATVEYGGEVFNFGPTSTWPAFPSVDETVSLVGFEFL